MDRFGPLADEPQVMRSAVTTWLDDAPELDPAPPGTRRDVMVGILVHRLFKSGRVLDSRDPEAQLTYARGLLQPEERAAPQNLGTDNIDGIVTEAVETWRAMCAREDVGALLTSGRLLHEAPFSLMTTHDGSPVVLRGTIDCLIQKHDGSIVVLEFKTGRPRPSHQRQLDIYVEAARALFPGVAVEGRLIYAH